MNDDPGGPQPATPSQFAGLALRLCGALFPGAPSLRAFCRVILLQPDARMLEDALRQMRGRKQAGRGTWEGREMARVFRWFAPDPGAALYAQARARYLDLLATALDSVPAFCEAAVCLHLAMLAGPDAVLLDETFAALALAQGGKARLLRGLPLHLSSDMGWDLTSHLLAHRAAYDPAELAFALALNDAFSEGSLAGSALWQHLDGLAGTPPTQGAVAISAVLRLGAFADPRARAAAHRHLARLALHAPGLRCVPAAPFIAAARIGDHSHDLADLAHQVGGTLDLLGLAEGALLWLDPQRRRTRQQGPWTPQHFAQATLTYRRWAFTHDLCRPVFLTLPTLSSAQRHTLRRLVRRGAELPLLGHLHDALSSWLTR